MDSPSSIAPPYVRGIAPYQGGRPISEIAREYGFEESEIVKLASNENPLGMSPKAREAMLAAAADLGRYPDGNGFELKAAISKRFGIPPDWITLGNGSNDILELAAHAFLQPDRESVYSQHSFAVYALATQATGAKAVVVPATAAHGAKIMAKRSSCRHNNSFCTRCLCRQRINCKGMLTIDRFAIGLQECMGSKLQNIV
ncbi:MAG: hypothetical protein ACKPBE_06655, partial [Betaproteobacteria bacterium]